MRWAIASPSRRRPSCDGTTDTVVPLTANVADDAGRTIPANAGSTAATIALRSSRTAIWPPSVSKRSAPSSAGRRMRAARPAPRTATGRSASAAARA